MKYIKTFEVNKEKINFDENGYSEQIYVWNKFTGDKTVGKVKKINYLEKGGIGVYKFFGYVIDDFHRQNVIGVYNNFMIKSSDWGCIKKASSEEIDLYNKINDDPLAYRSSIKYNL